MTSGNLTPAYGRVYTTRTEAVKDWEDGKDFKFLNIYSPYHGKYCSIRDFGPGDNLQLRFGRCLQHVVMVRGK